MSKLEELSNKMEELAPYALPNHNHDDAKQQEFYRVQKLYWIERDRLSAERKKNPQHYIPATKVNGYGEATHREITSSTYERAQSRLKKDVESFLK